MFAIVDTGPLYATVDEHDEFHWASLAVLERRDLTFVIPALVITEAAYLVHMRLGARAEARFLRRLVSYDIGVPPAEEWNRIAELVERYADFPLGAVDASVVALAERLETDVVVTLDHRHFRAVRPRHVAAFQILP